MRKSYIIDCTQRIYGRALSTIVKMSKKQTPQQILLHGVDNFIFTGKMALYVQKYKQKMKQKSHNKNRLQTRPSLYANPSAIVRYSLRRMGLTTPVLVYTQTISESHSTVYEVPAATLPLHRGFTLKQLVEKIKQ